MSQNYKAWGFQQILWHKVEHDKIPKLYHLVFFKKSQFFIVLLAPSQITPGPACKADHIFDLTLDREVEHYGYHNTTAVTERALSHSGKWKHGQLPRNQGKPQQSKDWQTPKSCRSHQQQQGKGLRAQGPTHQQWSKHNQLLTSTAPVTYPKITLMLSVSHHTHRTETLKQRNGQ